jgi:hypothetical protein
LDRDASDGQARSFLQKTTAAEPQSVVALLAGFSSLISIIFNVGYFSLVGMRFFSFLTLSDHVSTAVIGFVALVVYVGLAGAGYFLIRGRVLGAVAAIYLPVAFVLLLAIGVSEYVALSYEALLWRIFIFTFLTVVPLLIGGVFRLLGANLRELASVNAMPYVLATVCLFALLLGLMFGRYDISASEADDTVEVSDGASFIGVSVLRHLSTGYLLYVPASDQVVFVPDDRIVSIYGPRYPRWY